MLQVNQISCPLDMDINKLEVYIAKKCHIHSDDILSYRILRQSLDARKDIAYKISVLLETTKEKQLLKTKNKDIFKTEKPKQIVFESVTMKDRPIVVGFGPAGMFSALALAQAGCRPIIFERGKEVEKRTKDVHHFWKTGDLNTASNVQFGEGGAGTFSDGKLTTRIKDERISYILQQLVANGADENITYLQHPHIGSDRLTGIVKNIRSRILALGGEIHFEHQVEELIIKENRIAGVKVKNKDYYCKEVILAIGHSATDTIQTLYRQGVAMQSKDISIGVRIEHNQDWVNLTQYKEHFNNPHLPSAEYRLTMKTSDQRGVYTFCMCPGGSVVAASAQHQQLVVNGMSESKRDLAFANSALLVQVKNLDKENVFSALSYIENLEKKAYTLANHSYLAPAQMAQDFLKNIKSEKLIESSYLLGLTSANLNELFDEEISNALKEAILHFDKLMPGFKEGLLIAVESRSSSFVRIPRNEHYQSIAIKGLYPAGEGVGYGGGIMSCALDGLRCAQAILDQYRQ